MEKAPHQKATSRDGARRSLKRILDEFTFGRVLSVHITKRDARGIRYYHGAAEEVTLGYKKGGRHARRPRQFFFCSNNRAQDLGIMIGPAALMDLYGPSDFAPGYVPPPPPIGSLITGVLVVSQKEKSRYRHMFAQWSPEGAPVKELARVTSFGSRMGDEDLRRCMRLTRKEGRDDLWFLCKLVLYNDLDMMKHAFRVQATRQTKCPNDSETSRFTPTSRHL